jgi:hypothetical protein
LSASVNGEPVSKVGAVVTLKAVGSDANESDASSLIPDWSATIGTLSNGASDFEKIWTAPNVFTVATISVEIRDRKNAAGKAQLPILVGIDSPDQVDTTKPEATLSASLSEVKDLKPL